MANIRARRPGKRGMEEEIKRLRRVEMAAYAYYNAFMVWAYAKGEDDAEAELVMCQLRAKLFDLFRGAALAERRGGEEEG